MLHQIDGQTRKGRVKVSSDNILSRPIYMFTMLIKGRPCIIYHWIPCIQMLFVLFSDEEKSDRGNHPSSASCESEGSILTKREKSRPGKLRRGNHNRTPEKSIWELREIHLGSGANRRPLVPIVGQGGAAQGWLPT